MSELDNSVKVAGLPTVKVDWSCLSSWFQKYTRNTLNCEKISQSLGWGETNVSSRPNQKWLGLSYNVYNRHSFKCCDDAHERLWTLVSLDVAIIGVRRGHFCEYSLLSFWSHSESRGYLYNTVYCFPWDLGNRITTIWLAVARQSTPYQEEDNWCSIDWFSTEACASSKVRAFIMHLWIPRLDRFQQLS